ncbi:MAG: biotin--[acetyl-CoA-carboxylase] ligase [Propionibacteriaceae bacterium]|jgi:BirA family biotin operon repressor/biotin-[acetyl-CoA-carboxylase] ligase|nr:biotin--[acetyl-CoA-carboxylase] ligase [Propionibacteriaceae bacterium]
MIWNITTVERTGSTNADLAARAHGGALEPGDVLIAGEQMAGRGRLERVWSSPAGSSLALSAALALPAEPTRWPILPLAVGLATATAVTTWGIDARLKWPNDVLVEEKKLAGILVETRAVPSSTPNSQVKYLAIAGIGLNLSQTVADLPIPRATSLALAGATGITPREAADAVLGALGETMERWRAEGDAAVLEPYRRLCSTLGRVVDVTVPSAGGVETITGRAVAIGDDGRLGLDIAATNVPGDAVRWFGSGEIEHVRAAR